MSPPDGDIASEFLPPVPGIPTVEPGWEEITIPEPLVLPPAPLGGARTEPESPGPPRPEPFLPEPDSPGPEPIEGGGGTTLLASSVPLPEPPEFPEPVDESWPVREPATDGGGGMTPDAPSDEPEFLPEAEFEPPTEGGGGTMLVVSEPADAPAGLAMVPEAVCEETLGGGGTASCVPKSLPMIAAHQRSVGRRCGGWGDNGS